MTELILHVGGGKTGSSSIQETLLANRSDLAKLGISYWGLMLEHAPHHAFEWQHPGKTELFYKTQGSSEQLWEVLLKSLAIADKEGIPIVVWSNEWLLGAEYEYSRNLEVIDIAKRLIDSGQKVRVVAYIREHLSWAISAYSQWGLKHKTYQGPIVSFTEYTKDRPPLFLTPLKKWKEAAGESLRLYNFMTCGDVTAHFLEVVCNVSASSFRLPRVNDKPSPAEQFLRVAFNDIYPAGKPCIPQVFDEVVGKHLADHTGRNLIEWYQSLFPTLDQLKSLRSSLQDDVNGVNSLLLDSGEPPLALQDIKSNNVLSNNDISYVASLMSSLAMNVIIEHQALTFECAALRRQVKELQSKLTNPSN